MTPRQRSNNGLAGRVYVANFGSDTVSVIDTATNTVIHTISGVGPEPIGVAVTQTLSGLRSRTTVAKVYVVNLGAGTVSVISAASNTVIATINPVGFENLRGRDHGLCSRCRHRYRAGHRYGEQHRHGDDHGPGHRTLRARGLAGGQ
jgi:YVTN family beta-propeller protein